MTKKKRQGITLLLLCIILIAAGVGYYGLTRYMSAQEEEEEAADEEGTPLYDISSEDVEKMSFVNSKAELSLVKEKNTWKIGDDKAFPLDQDRIIDMVDEMTGAAADQVVTEKCEDLAEYNLDKPELSVEITDKSGNTETLLVGMESLSGGGRYACRSTDKSTVYLISTSIYTSFDYSLEQLMTLPEIPSIDAEKVVHLQIDSRKGKGFEARYDKEDSRYKDIYSWEINEPYAQSVAGDQDQLQTLFENYANLSFSSGITYKKDAAKEKKYGLTNPRYVITVEAKKDSITLLVGSQTKDKASYYVQLKGEDGIYLMEAATVEELVKIQALDYVYQRLYAGSLEQLKSMELTYQGETYSYRVTKKKDEAGQESSEDASQDGSEYTYTVKKDGKKVDADAFTSAFDAISNLAPNGEIEDKKKAGNNMPRTYAEKAVAEFVFHEEKKDVTLKVYSYDGKNFYRIEVYGVMQFVVDIRTIDNILDSFTSIK